MAHQVILSIVMPVYNRSELVIEMLRSIQDNTFQDWKVIAVDDGSAPEHYEQIASFAQQDTRIHYLKREQQLKGAQTCRNEGMQKAKGEFICFFDSDDYIAPHGLAQRVAALQERPDLDFVVFPSLVYLPDGIKTYHPGCIYGYPVYPDDLKAFIRRTLPFIVWSNIYRTSSLGKQGLIWDTTLLSLQDSDFNLQAILKGLKYDYAIVGPDYAYRIANNGESISKRIASKEHLQSQLYLIHKTYQTVQQKFGGKFNKDLYLGVLFIYNKIFTNGIDFSTANELSTIVGKFDVFHGKALLWQVKCSRLLQRFVTPKRARQIPMLPFLIYQQLRNKYYNMKLKKTILRYETNH
jgi:glycosyltransferase involved in cell wall biosynthesis